MLRDLLKKLAIEAIEKFNPNDPRLSEKVRERLNELKSEGKEIVAFYDKVTKKIFINQNAKDEEVRASIAREYKIKEDLELGRGKANDKGQLRSTVAGEIAYEEIKNRLKKGDKNPVSASNFEIAKMDKDSEVTADLADKDIEAQYFNTLKYASAIGDGSWENNPKILEEMRGATGEITDFTSKPNYFLKTIDKEWAETKEGKKKIAIADGIIESLNKNSSDKEYYKIIDGRKKEVIIASNPKAKSYVYHLGKSISAPFRTDEYKVFSFNANRSFTDDVKELTGIVLGGLSDLSKPFTLGIGSKLGDESGRVGKGSSQYGTREVIEGKQEFIRSSVKSATDMVVTPIVMRSVGVGISKGKEVIRKYKSYDLEYSASIAQKATDTYHKTPVQFDEFLIKNGTSYIRNDGRIEYMMKGYVNGREGIYHITVKDGNIIIHKDFLPMHRWEEFRVKYELPKYDKIK